MEFKDNYYSIEGRLNNVANNKNIKKIIIEKSTNGMRNEGNDKGVYKFVVLPEEYDVAVKLAKKINASKSIDHLLEEAEMKERYEEHEELCKRFEPKEKKDIKSKIENNKKNKKYTASKILTRILSTLLAASAAIGGAKFAYKQVEEYKDEVAKTSLHTLKEELNAKEIMDNSSIISSATDVIKIEIKGNDGNTYTYYVENHYGEPFKTKDNINNPNVVDAVRTVASAQGGNVFDAIKAKKLMKEIENDDIYLGYPGNHTKEDRSR